MFVAGLDPCQPSAFSSYFIHQYAICMHGQSNYIGSKPRFSNNSGLVNEDRSFFTKVSHIFFFSFAVSSIANQPQEPNKETDHFLIIIIASVCGFVVMAAFVCCCVCFCM